MQPFCSKYGIATITSYKSYQNYIFASDNFNHASVLCTMAGGEEEEVGGGTSDEQLISSDMACPIRPPPHTFAAELCLFLSVLAKLCYESVHSKLRSTMSISSTIAALLILVLGFSAGYHTGMFMELTFVSVCFLFDFCLF